MTPARGMKFPLRQILSAMKQVDDSTPPDLNDLDPVTRAQVIAEMGKFNVHQSNMEGTTADGKAQEARDLIRMAEMLEADATARRAQAYAIDPTLNPVHKSKTSGGSWLEESLTASAKKAVPKSTAKKPAAKKVAAKK